MLAVLQSQGGRPAQEASTSPTIVGKPASLPYFRYGLFPDQNIHHDVQSCKNSTGVRKGHTSEKRNQTGRSKEQSKDQSKHDEPKIHSAHEVIFLASFL
jgi:hypothetical protein